MKRRRRQVPTVPIAPITAAIKGVVDLPSPQANRLGTLRENGGILPAQKSSSTFAELWTKNGLHKISLAHPPV